MNPVNRVAGFLDGLRRCKDKFDIVAQQDGAAALDISIPIAEDIIQANPDLNAFSALMTRLHSVRRRYQGFRQDGNQRLLHRRIPGRQGDYSRRSFTAVAAQVPIGIAETAFEKAEELLAGGEIEKRNSVTFLPGR